MDQSQPITTFQCDLLNTLKKGLSLLLGDCRFIEEKTY